MKHMHTRKRKKGLTTLNNKLLISCKRRQYMMIQIISVILWLSNSSLLMHSRRHVPRQESLRSCLKFSTQCTGNPYPCHCHLLCTHTRKYNKFHRLCRNIKNKLRTGPQFCMKCSLSLTAIEIVHCHSSTHILYKKWCYDVETFVLSTYIDRNKGINCFHR